MTALRDVARPVRPMPGRRWRVRIWREAPRGAPVIAVLALGTVVITGLLFQFPDMVPLSSLAVPLLLGSLLIGPRQLPWFVLFVMVMLALTLTRDALLVRNVVGVVILLLLCLIVLIMSFRRSRLGVAGVLGESMLVDLRDRILGQGGIPELPDGWYAESALRSAGGSPFAGDFIVTSRSGDGARLEVVVVDVSGKGEQAGTRALLLSGAFGGLLTALAPQDFLVAANDYLLRQDWEEGFATAVHLSLDLTTGAFEIRTAGHPPAIHRVSGSGRWEILETEGPALGILPAADFPAVAGRLGRQDALLLYTDGMVETPTRDIGLGIDRMLGQAERRLRNDFDGGAARLVDAVGSQHDDRALLLVHRR